jgi:IS30 family transposase
MPSGTLQKQARLRDLAGMVMAGQLSNREIARRMGVHPVTVSRWLGEHRQMLVEQMRQQQRDALEASIKNIRQDISRLGDFIDNLLDHCHSQTDPRIVEAIKLRAQREKRLAKLTGYDVVDHNPYLRKKEKPLPAFPGWY